MIRITILFLIASLGLILSCSSDDGSNLSLNGIEEVNHLDINGQTFTLNENPEILFLDRSFIRLKMTTTDEKSLIFDIVFENQRNSEILIPEHIYEYDPCPFRATSGDDSDCDSWKFLARYDGKTSSDGLMEVSYIPSTTEQILRFATNVDGNIIRGYYKGQLN